MEETDFSGVERGKAAQEGGPEVGSEDEEKFLMFQGRGELRHSQDGWRYGQHWLLCSPSPAPSYTPLCIL